MEEKESFRFLLGVFRSAGESSTMFCLDVLLKAGPWRLRAGEWRAFKAWRFVLTVPGLELPLSFERGVKNFLSRLGVTEGCPLGLRRAPASDAIDGGDEGTSWDENWKTGSEWGIS